MSEDNDGRLSRIENKLDTLTDAVSRLAVVDARLSDFIQLNSRISARISDLETKTAVLSQENAVQEVKLDALVKVTWTLAMTVGVAITSGILKVLGIV